ncbi:MAG: ATP-binding protein [Elainella sp. Prado103]|jgi:PAS domain S-box-containing protein|nr:ATP-binding protein [Elainella sp. Prado103]
MKNILRILFIDDSDSDTQAVLNELLDSGFALRHQRVDSAVTLQLALQQYAWDIVICDYLLPSFNALEALQIMKSLGLDLPFIVLSGMIGEEPAVEMMRAGASDYLFKRHLKRLVPAIERELHDLEMRQARRQAEATALQLAAIVESSDDAIISTNLQGYVLTWNLGAEKLYGYSAAEAKGQPLSQLIQPIGNSLLAVPPQNSCHLIADWRQVTRQRKTGELIDILQTVSLIKDPQGSVVGFAIIARDISERQRIQRMKDEFISVINHELRTPLASLQGSIELLLTGKLGELSDQGLKMLRIAANNIDRLAAITSNILDLEGLSSGEIQMIQHPCNLAEAVNRATALLQDLAMQRQVTLLITPQSIEVSADNHRLSQVFYHLLKNAIQFSQAGGRIWLEIKQCHDRQELASIPHLFTSEQIRIPCVLVKVKDEGQGIPSDQLESIFGQFQQVDASDARRQGGAGLGLAICRRIVQQHQGQLWAESVLGEGSTFYLTLPLQRVAVQTL